MYSKSIIEALRELVGADNVDVLSFPGASRAGKLSAVFRSWRSSLPAKSLYVCGEAWAELVPRAIRRHGADVVFLDTADMLLVRQSVPAGIPTVLIAHNVEARLRKSEVERRARSAGPARVVLRSLLEWEADKLQRLEEGGARAIKNVLSISRDDAAYFRALGPDMHVGTAAPAFRYRPFEGRKRPASLPLHIGFLGTMWWWPNRQAADWFVQQVLDGIPDGRILAHFFGPGSEQYAGRHPRLQAHGVVADLSTVWNTCDIMVCPMQSGSGVNIKFVESLFNGVPVLGTAISARGLPPLRGDGVRLLDSAGEWVDFLNSAQAEAFARRGVAPEIRSLFAPAEQRKAVAEHLASLAGA